MKSAEKVGIFNPKNQLQLYGYEDYFSLFTNIFKRREIPSSYLISGPRGIGKSTFIYHFVNYLLSKNEDKKYSKESFEINFDNSSYKLLAANTHPNFFLLDINNDSSSIKIDQVRNLIEFTNKSSYSKEIKIVMIDNAESLNLNSYNALLKSIEEANKNTFFFIIHNSSYKILNTIKSRCLEFKIFFSELEKKNILKKLINQNGFEFNGDSIYRDLYFDTPGNLLNYFLLIKECQRENKDDNLSIILYLMEKFRKDKKKEILFFLSLLIDKFYNYLYLKNDRNIYNYFFNHKKILNIIFNMKKYNLDEKISFVLIKNILVNESK